MRAITQWFLIVSILRGVTVLFYRTINENTHNDNNKSDSSIYDLGTDDLSGSNVLQVVFDSTTPFEYHQGYWSAERITTPVGLRTIPNLRCFIVCKCGHNIHCGFGYLVSGRCCYWWNSSFV